MDVPSIDTLVITKATLHLTSEYRLVVHFFLQNNERRYVLTADHVDKKWVPHKIEHDILYMIEEQIGQSCPFCEDTDLICDFLDEEKEAFCEKLLNHPKVRLKLLFE